jgi:hypothetical protein
MNDGLEYIREAIRKEGNNAKVDVVRWEKDAKTGYFSKPFKVEIKADIALKQLEIPISKRSRVWRMIRPLGMTLDGNISAPAGVNRLNSPDLIEQLKAELRAELKAEMISATMVEEKPKRKRKNSETEITESDDIEETTITEA